MKRPLHHFFDIQAPIRSEKGMALLLTITIITIITAVAFDYNIKSRNAVVTSSVMIQRMKLGYMAESGIHAGVALLIKDKADSSSDSLQEDWANTDKLKTLVSELPFASGELKLRISDELGKIQVNALVKFPEGRAFNDAQKNMLQRFLFSLKSGLKTLKEIDPNTIINATKDWIDFGDDDAITGINGAESNYYNNLNPPYSCRNRPLSNIGELIFVKGISREWFNSIGGTSTISDYFSVYGASETNDNRFTYEGKININTADVPVLAAFLPSGDVQLAKAINEYRVETSDSKYIHDLSDPKWYKKVPGLSDVEIDPKLITISSDVFRIESSAELEGMKISIISIIKRDKNKKTGKWDSRVLSWQVK